MSVRMRHTKGHTGNRRAHHKIAAPRLSFDKDSQTHHVRHRMCEETGMYRGVVIVDMKTKTLKKLERTKRKQKEKGEEVEKG